MKCLVLAGGSGDRLWPLSRKNFPKQFMSIRKGRSMFQEAILRNIPFCDEFIIITNKKYESVVKGQLQDFQDLKYSIFMEEVPMKTAPSITTLALNFEASEEFLIVSTDCIIDGDYNTYITKLKELVKRDKVVALTAVSKTRVDSRHYFEVTNGKIKYTTVWGKGCCIDCGVMGVKVSVLLKSLDSAFVEQCKRISIVDNHLIEKENTYVSHVGLADVIKTDRFELVKTDFVCSRITDISSYYNVLGKEDMENVIENDCKDVKIINATSDKLVVANDLKNIIIANTRDAVYVAKADGKSDVKEIANAYYEQKNAFFDDYPIYYYEWGIAEVLSLTPEYRVSRITLYPKCGYTEKADKGTFINYFITEGVINVIVKDKKETFKSNENISVHCGSSCELFNDSKYNIVLIRTENRKSSVRLMDKTEDGCMVKLKPNFKDFIWGGTKIRDILNKPVGKRERIAESWELSAHSAGQSKIASGKFKGMTLGEFINEIGVENLGWKAQDYERFPLLIKFIDSKEDLSIQVHPDDDYAFPNEGDYGKNEMWYIMSAEKNACVYMGFNRDVTKEEVRQRIKDNTLIQVLNKIHVKAGETYFLKTGTVHAIGAGCLICEIQQSSNVTYRLYDYGRIDEKGKPRELHIEKGLEVLDLKKSSDNFRSEFGSLDFKGYTKRLLGQCKYFVATKYTVHGELSLAPTGSSFRAVVVIDGSGKIGNGHILSNTALGDTWFCGSKDMINLKGNFTVIVASV